jgi:hypothetical protein
MKTLIKILSNSLLILLLLNSTVLAGTNFGAKGAANESTLNLSKMLNYAIQDEYLAQAEYAYIIEKFGNSRPFSNIIKAEKKHIEMLVPIFEKYKIFVPENIAANYLIKTSSIKESLSAGVQAEIENIDMYKHFLKQDLPGDVKVLFERLMKASQNHLRAFKKALSRY